MRFKFAPLAQLVEQLTLNQWVPGSNPWRCTSRQCRLPNKLLKKLSNKSVFLTQRVHPFPFRTRKLSFAVPKILVWRRTGKIGHSRHQGYTSCVSLNLFLLSSVGRRPRKTIEYCFSTGDHENKEFWSREYRGAQNDYVFGSKHDWWRPYENGFQIRHIPP